MFICFMKIKLNRGIERYYGLLILCLFGVCCMIVLYEMCYMCMLCILSEML